MAEEIDLEKCNFRKFRSQVTLTLALDRVIRHAFVHHSSTSIYKNIKHCRFITTCKAHNWHIKQQKFFRSRQGPWINTVFIIYTALDVTGIFTDLCVSIMGLTRCYKATLFMAALRNRTGQNIFALWFLSFFFFYLFPSPNVSGRRLDVYHTSTDGVALVQI